MNELPLFNSNMLLTKQDVMDSFEKFKSNYLDREEKQSINENERNVFISLCEKFNFQLLNKNIEDIVTPWHFYEYRMNIDGIELSLYEADEDVEFDENFRIEKMSFGEKQKIISVKAPYYSIMEFAKHHNVSEKTVQQ